METKLENGIAKKSPIFIMVLIVGIPLLLTALLSLIFGMAGRISL
jgi:hypothetical protein